MCADVGLRNTAVRSDGPGRNGRLRMNDGVRQLQIGGNGRHAGHNGLGALVRGLVALTLEVLARADIEVG